MMTLRERYLNDPNLSRLVYAMVSEIDNLNLTPTEIREAAMLASIIYEERNVRALTLVEPEVEMLLREIREKVSEKGYPGGS